MGFDASLAHMVRHWAAVRPEANAITVNTRDPVTYRRLDELTSWFGNALRARGVGHGDRVAFLGRDTLTWAVTAVGASKVRATGIPLNWRLARPEMADVLADADAAVLVCEPDLLPLAGFPARAVEDGVYVLADGTLTRLDDLLVEHGGEDPGEVPEPEDIACVFYTSGTTGRPKGVQLANRNFTSNLARPMPWEIGTGDRVFVPAPSFHISGSGWLVLSLARGAHALFVTDVVPAQVLRMFESQRITHALVVPALLRMLVLDPVARDVDYASLRVIIYGGSPITTAVLTEAREVFGADLVQGYGMTETTGPITVLGPEDHAPAAPEHRLASAGRPVEGIDVGVFDPVSGEPARTGQVGEVWTRSGQVMAGYRNRPAEQAEVTAGDGWLRTGDAGYFDEDGYLYLTDRVKDMIVSGAENVYPAEVENVLMSHPDVADAAVIGVPHDRWGETVKAIIVPTVGSTVDRGAVIAYCRDRIAHYKCPTSVEFVEELPRNPSGKVLKRVLRQDYWPAGVEERAMKDEGVRP